MTPTVIIFTLAGLLVAALIVLLIIGRDRHRLRRRVGNLNNELLDVEYGCLGLVEDAHERCGDARLVRAADPHEHSLGVIRPVVLVHRARLRAIDRIANSRCHAQQRKHGAVTSLKPANENVSWSTDRGRSEWLRVISRGCSSAALSCC